MLSPDEFLHWSRPSDLALLDEAKDLWCNILHLHGATVYFDATVDYPVQVINWHDRETPPSLAEARGRFRGVLCGGLARDTLIFRTPDEVRAEARAAMTQVQGRHLLLSTGCVVPVITPHGNIVAARRAVDDEWRPDR
jgi:uroporphyrinogen decarboxylase